jgi:pectate lyase
MKTKLSHLLCGVAMAGWLAAGLVVGAQTTLPAFPGAEGFGASATGGRGGDLYEVTNLNDAGPGSLRDAVSRGNRTVTFRVSGTIQLNKRLTLSEPNITLAGQTAPGDGICLREHELFIGNTQNIIVRFIRSRPGDEAKAEMDAVTIWNSKDVILDHCSMSWSTDSLNDVVKESGNVTVQWCLLAEPLNDSVHSKGSHGYATGWDGRTKGGGSFHHNLIAHAASRAPRIGYYKTGRGLIDCRNNVIYNSGASYGGETDDFNYVGNYYRPGPDTAKLRQAGSIFDIWSADSRMFVDGNVYEGNEAVSADNRKGIIFKAGKNANGDEPKGDAQTCLVHQPFKVVPVRTDKADIAYQRVLESAGAILPQRDAVDQRIVKSVRDRTGGMVNSPAAVGGWPELQSAPAPTDSDHDGMPDEWEQSHKLDPNDSSDGKAISGSGYSNLENYLNDLAAKASGDVE